MQDQNLSWEFISKSVKSSHRLAASLAVSLPAGSILALDGQLGSGKTTFIQGLGKYLEIAEPIVSPTYALLHEYPGKKMPLVHMDFYRLENLASAYALGLDEQLKREDALIAVEWASKLPELFPKTSLKKIVFLNFMLTGPAANQRCIKVTGLAKPTYL